jgi:hypothetical protein
MNVGAGPPAERKPCHHDSTRRDGTLDCNCLRCGMDGYWHDGHNHEVSHPSGKVLIRLACPPATASGQEQK